jgi:hypothetical protein
MVALAAGLTSQVSVGQVSAGQVREDKARAGVVSRPQVKEDTSQRIIEGVVLDADKNPVPRAVLQLKDLRTLQVRSFVSQVDGKYRFTGLRLDTDYEVKATLADLSSEVKRVSSYDSRNTVTVNFTLAAKK